jgi:hypothetical protein
VEAVGQPLPIALFVRQSFGSLDVLINEGLVWLIDFQGLQHDRSSNFAPVAQIGLSRSKLQARSIAKRSYAR